MHKKWPYDEVSRDVRELEICDGDKGPRDFDELMRDRETGINAESDEGIRDGVTKVRRMNPDHYIPNPR